MRLVRTGVRAWLAPRRPDHPGAVDDPGERRALIVELVLVFSMTLGLAGLRSLLSLLDSLLRTEPLSKQSVALNVSRAAQQLIDLGFQLTGVLQLAAWGGLAVYLLWRTGIGPRLVGLDRTRLGRDVAVAVGLAVVIGIPGIGLYLAAKGLDLNLTVRPSTLGDHWWRTPVLVLSAAGNAWAEEVLVVGYLLTRLRQLGLGENARPAGVRRTSWVLPPLPGVRRVRRQPGHGPDLRPGLAADQPAVAAGDRAHSARRGGIRGVRLAPRKGRLAAMTLRPESTGMHPIPADSSRVHWWAAPQSRPVRLS